MDLREVGYDDRDWINLAQDRDRWLAYLTEKQKTNRMAASLGHSQRYHEEEYAFLSCIVTGDESWCYHFEPESKRQSQQWKHMDSPPPKKSKAMHTSSGKVMLTFFFDSRGPLLVEFLEHGATINAQRYEVKRAQEVMMFGNQQNRPSTENKLYPSAHKRASNKQEKDEELPTALPIAISSTSKTWENGNKLAHHEQHGNGGKTNARGNINYPGGQRAQYRQELGNGDMADQQEDHGRGKTVSQYEKGYQYGVGKAALDKHVENALLKSELYGDPGSVNQYRYYGGSSERKRNQHLSYPPPSKRSYQPEMPFVLPTDDLTSSRSRLKRDLGLDPEDVLTVLSLWEAEHRAKAESNPGLDPSWFTYYGLDTAEPFRDDEDEGEEDEEDTSPIDGKFTFFTVTGLHMHILRVSWRLASKLSTASSAIFFRDVPEEDGRASRRKLGS
ncbi:hypothetical protein ANN_09226 [Periplaneta americana]|uniref:Uncharacterized protein n=1 Tax=Periplaneta americana TaxID=6978 RepID=A0ABQ8TKT8_PERAM|nr:hypothetical protein ANN_09226 [Periplaneta americana]